LSHQIQTDFLFCDPIPGICDLSFKLRPPPELWFFSVESAFTMPSGRLRKHPRLTPTPRDLIRAPFRVKKSRRFTAKVHFVQECCFIGKKRWLQNRCLRPFRACCLGRQEILRQKDQGRYGPIQGRPRIGMPGRSPPFASTLCRRGIASEVQWLRRTIPAGRTSNFGFKRGPSRRAAWAAGGPGLYTRFRTPVDQVVSRPGRAENLPTKL